MFEITNTLFEIELQEYDEEDKLSFYVDPICILKYYLIYYRKSNCFFNIVVLNIVKISIITTKSLTLKWNSGGHPHKNFKMPAQTFAL